MVFTWDGKIIPDIEVWCSERQTTMVTCRVSRPVMNPMAGTVETEEWREEIPRVFLESMLTTDGAVYEVVGERPPRLG